MCLNKNECAKCYGMSENERAFSGIVAALIQRVKCHHDFLVKNSSGYEYNPIHVSLAS
jgi:hypothetical protein